MILIGYGGVCAFVFGLVYWCVRRRRIGKRKEGVMSFDVVDVEVGESDPLKRD